MKWTDEADKAISKVPFFVRKKVRARVEKEAGENGKTIVTLADVKETQNRFLNRMESEIKGFQVDTCFGSGGCPNRLNNTEKLQKDVETLLKNEDLIGFLKNRVKAGLKYHHEFRVTFADCPNACSQPQIKDVGIIGAEIPEVTETDCSHCDQCAETCKENAITINQEMEKPVIDFDGCVRCGQCISVCPTGTIKSGDNGYRILLGGKLGRHPKLATELPGLYAEDSVLKVLKRCMVFYKQYNCEGERFGKLIETHPEFIENLKRNPP